MNVLIVYGHPEPKSLNGHLKNIAEKHLISLGYQVKVSDLHKMKQKAVADTEDFKNPNKQKRLFYIRQSKRAYENGMQALAIEEEQDKLMWADAIIFQFPLWWFVTSERSSVNSLVIDCVFYFDLTGQHLHVNPSNRLPKWYV